MASIDLTPPGNVINKLRESKPENLFFACDGARTGKKGEQKLVDEVRNVMGTEIDWPCEKHYRYNQENKGCEVTESEAISWVLHNNEYVIIIEDDIIAPYSFLKFAQDMLYRYKDDKKVFQVTSDNVTPMPLPNNEGYCFSMHGHIWGWATWRRAWKHFDLYMKYFEDARKKLRDRTDLTQADKNRFGNMCKRLIAEEKNNTKEPKHTWDVVWGYVKWRDGGLSIVPRVHLSSNVGVVGLHSKVQTSSHFRPYEEEFEAIKYPAKIERCLEYDEYHYATFLKQPPYLIRQWRRGIGFIKRKFLKRGD